MSLRESGSCLLQDRIKPPALLPRAHHPDQTLGECCRAHLHRLRERHPARHFRMKRSNQPPVGGSLGHARTQMRQCLMHGKPRLEKCRQFVQERNPLL